MKNGLNHFLDELGKRWFLLVGICALLGSYIGWRVDTANIRFTQEAHASAIKANAAKIESIDRATLIIEHDIPIIKEDIKEIKRDIRLYIRKEQ